MPTMKNIILCGFMGCGKSTVGRLLSKQAGFGFADIDEYIVKSYGMSINEIFAKYGEETFRKMETDACKHFSEKGSLVISSGGGTVMNAENVSLLKKGGIIVLLDVSLEELKRRLKHDRSRPLLQAPNPDKRIEELFNSRIDTYRMVADVTVNGDKSPSEIVAYILKKILV